MKILHSSFLLFLILLLSCEKKETFSEESKNNGQNEFYLKGKKFYSVDTDSAYINFSKALQAFIAKKDSLGVAKSLTYLAIIQTGKGDYFGSDENLIRSLDYLKNLKNVNDYFFSAYNQIAINKEYQKNYKAAIYWYQLAENVNTDAEYRLFIKNNKAVAFFEDKNYTNALRILENLIEEIKEKNNSSFYAQVINNYAYTKFLQNPNYNAEGELYKALKIRTQEKDLWGLNSSYAAIADYYMKKEPQKALSFAHKMLEVATELNSPDDRLEALQKLILLEGPGKSKSYFTQYQNLSDSLQTARAKAKNQFALIRYEAEKKETENQQLKAETAQQENRILRQNILVVLLLFGVLLLILWFRQRRRLLAQEEQVKIKSTELKYSKKVHDVVANGIYRVLSEVENNRDLSREKLLDTLENIYEKSRDISYDPPSGASGNFYEDLNGLISSYASETRKILIVNAPELWEEVAVEIQLEVRLIIQELLVNLKKHSKANFARLAFETENRLLKISYADNGVGMTKNGPVKKNGLQNTESRIFSLNGNISFVTDLEKGIKIIIEIPV